MRKNFYYIDKNGNSKYKAYQIHRLVAMMFTPNPDNKPYKAPSKCNGGITKERLKYLQTLNGIQIMYYEDYLKEQNK